MTTTSELLLEAYGRIDEVVHQSVEGLDEATLTARPAPGANTIAWLVWHLARVQDDHVAGVAGTEQVWERDGWVDRCDLSVPRDTIWYGFDEAQVGEVRIPAELLLGYFDAVSAATREYLAGLVDGDLDRVVDDSYDPPVTLAARLVSVLSDDLQHAGQAAYVRGILMRG